MGGKDKMGPMFPRLHINDAEKGGPRAPPRNKMALYEQLTIPSQRSTHSIQMPPRHYSDLTTPSAQTEAKKKLDEDDFIVPIFTHSVPIKNPNIQINTTSQERISPSYSPFFHHSPKSQTAGVPEHNSVTHVSRINTTDLEEEKIYSSVPRKAPLPDPDVVCGLDNDSDSETSILDVVCEPDMTPDDIVGVIGQKRFWKARRAIVNQQRVFSVQVFELHRLVEVQKLIAASPHLLAPENNLPSDFTLKAAAALDDPKKRKALFEKSPREIESSTENSVGKKTSSSPHPYPTDHLVRNSQSPPSIASSKNTISPYPDQPKGHHWLVPFMSPFEGLVYRPYPGPTGPPAHQYHGYLPPYAVPMMNTFSPHFSGPVSEDVGVQVSTSSSAVESVVLPVRADFGPELGMRSSRVIKAVARNGLSASESAARIFRSIQEERRRC